MYGRERRHREVSCVKVARGHEFLQFTSAVEDVEVAAQDEFLASADNLFQFAELFPAYGF